MVISDLYEIPVVWTLGVVLFVLMLSVQCSVMFPKRDPVKG